MKQWRRAASSLNSARRAPIRGPRRKLAAPGSGLNGAAGAALVPDDHAPARPDAPPLGGGSGNCRGWGSRMKTSERAGRRR